PRPWPRWSMAMTRKRRPNAPNAVNQFSPPVAANPCSRTIVGALGGPATSRMYVVPRPGNDNRRPGGTPAGAVAPALFASASLGIVATSRLVPVEEGLDHGLGPGQRVGPLRQQPPTGRCDLIR